MDENLFRYGRLVLSFWIWNLISSEQRSNRCQQWHEIKFRCDFYFRLYFVIMQIAALVYRLSLLNSRMDKKKRLLAFTHTAESESINQVCIITAASSRVFWGIKHFWTLAPNTADTKKCSTFHQLYRIHFYYVFLSASFDLNFLSGVFS